MILDQLPSEGQTVIEKLEKYAQGDVSFAVVLATPDDEGNAVGKQDERRSRARQNVGLELGLLLTKLGRPRVAILLKNQEKMERPSDIQGLIYLPFTDDVAEVKVQLAKEMEKQGLYTGPGSLPSRRPPRLRTTPRSCRRHRQPLPQKPAFRRQTVSLFGGLTVTLMRVSFGWNA